MALFNHLFPYSNLHDINLDWIISIIKSIDPAVIQALQELTPDIIEQVNQKVNEAQAAAIAAQSSASEANTARENANASAAEAAQDATEAASNAALANADAVRAENAKTAVENSLVPATVNITTTEHLSNVNIAEFTRSGNTATISIDALVKSKSNEYWTAIATMPVNTTHTIFAFGYLAGNRPVKAKIENNTISLESGSLANLPVGLTLFNVTFYVA